jgi:hypothetical protein
MSVFGRSISCGCVEDTTVLFYCILGSNAVAKPFLGPHFYVTLYLFFLTFHCFFLFLRSPLNVVGLFVDPPLDVAAAEHSAHMAGLLRMTSGCVACDGC